MKALATAQALAQGLAAMLLAVSLGMLVACGGGSGNSAASDPVVRPLVLALSGDQQVTVGASLDNRAVSPNGRAVTYSSSDARVATVNASGRVDTLARGTATITATEARTDSGAQSISYAVLVLPAVLRGSFIDGTSLQSSNTGITYPYTVYLPAGYVAGYAAGSKRYPVVYMTDGQWTSNLYQHADRLGKEVILVMIYQGPENSRMVDYTAPGANAYMRFLKSEMVPRIESSYRSDNARTFYGVSAGGTLGAMLLANEPVGTPFFSRYILADGAYQLLTPETAQQEAARFNASPVLDIDIFLTGTRQANLALSLAMAERYRGRGYSGMTMRVSEYQVTHEQMSDPTFAEAMAIYF